MDYRIEKKELYTILYFMPGDPGKKDLPQDVIDMLTDASKVPVFDFNSVVKFDLPSLTALEPVFSLVKKSGRKLAICCGQITVQAVLDTAGYLAGTIGFATEAELEKNLYGFLHKSAPKQGQETPLTGGNLSFLNKPGLYLGLLLFIIALLIIVLISVIRLGNRVKSIESVLSPAYGNAMPAASVAPLISPKNEPAVTEEQLLKELEDASPANAGQTPADLLAAGQEFLAAENTFKAANSRVASDLRELGWLPSNSKVVAVKYAVTLKGDLASVVLRGKNNSETWKINTNGQWKKM
jgi:hypothetical protein